MMQRPLPLVSRFRIPRTSSVPAGHRGVCARNVRRRDFAGAGAGAASRITEPVSNPYHVAIDASGKPVPFTIVADGLPAGRQAFIEQCDGLPPSAPNWSVDRDCDLGGSPSPVIVDPQGVARFSATDANHGFVPVMGESPQSLFNCLRPGAKAPSERPPELHDVSDPSLDEQRPDH